MRQWPMVKLGDISSLDYGAPFKSSQFNDEGRGLPVVRIRDVDRGFSKTFYDGTFEPRHTIKDGDFLIGMDGKFSISAWRGGQALLNQRVCRVARETSDNVDRHFLFHFLPRALKEIEARKSFVTVKHLSARDLSNLEITLPPLKEQRRIAQVLTISSRNVALNQETSARILDAATTFMKQVVESSNSNQPLETFASIQGGSTPSKVNPEFWNGSIPWFSSKDLKHPTLSDSIDHITEQALEQTSLKSITSPGIAVSNRGMSLAHTLPTSIIPTGSCVNQDLKVFLPNDQEDLKFLYYVLRVREPEILTKVTSSAHGTRRLDVKHLKQVPVPVLSAAERAEVNEQIAAIEALHQFALDKSDKLQELHRSLATRAFAGEL